MLGEKTGPPRARPGTMAAAVPDAPRRASTSARRPREPGTIQWAFPDADPWHLVVDNGETHAAAGPGRAAAVTIECRYEDWTDLLGGRVNGLKLAATRRLRPRGDLRWLWSARRMFPG